MRKPPGEVGYGRPPVASRFRKGVSGNPSGRKKGVRPLKSDLAEELSALVQVTENGRVRRYTKQRLIVKTLIAKAAKGDNPSIAKLIDVVSRLYGLGPDEADGAPPLSADDREVLEAYLARRRGREDGRQA